MKFHAVLMLAWMKDLFKGCGATKHPSNANSYKGGDLCFQVIFVLC